MGRGGVAWKRLTTTGGEVYGGRCRLRCYILIGGTTLSRALFEDGGTGGTAQWQDSLKAQTNVGDDNVRFAFPGDGIEFGTDLYCTMVGTGAILYVGYTPYD